jgi:uncharacterized protein (DUF2141 family)
MKKYLIILLLTGLGFPLFSWSQGISQTVLVTNLARKKGNIYIGWYDNEKNYLHPDAAVIRKIVPVNGQEEVSVTFPNVKPGTYAITVFLDENENAELDTNFLGIPKEGYGFSNNVLPATRSASFKEASFSVNALSETIQIKIK